MTAPLTDDLLIGTAGFQNENLSDAPTQTAGDKGARDAASPSPAGRPASGAPRVGEPRAGRTGRRARRHRLTDVTAVHPAPIRGGMALLPARFDLLRRAKQAV
ncbi:hypothetical protein [Burkholderia plantarii]|uniref:hypothetical protein n=1 Tax=Burkholderia plantarii TaxID=41899 RepID=UPI0005AEF4E7|nr:hypothetical protein [Burkholderia plantarii]GLZ16803.1 hypothetical protein Bpla01_03330 [Burkholderia plantarii]